MGARGTRDQHQGHPHRSLARVAMSNPSVIYDFNDCAVPDDTFLTRQRSGFGQCAYHAAFGRRPPIRAISKTQTGTGPLWAAGGPLSWFPDFRPRAASQGSHLLLLPARVGWWHSKIARLRLQHLCGVSHQRVAFYNNIVGDRWQRTGLGRSLRPSSIIGGGEAPLSTSFITASVLAAQLLDHCRDGGKGSSLPMCLHRA